jgi:hypothetical protein
MHAPATGTGSGNPTSPRKAIRHEDRNTWVLTVYAMTGIAFFGALFYYIAEYATN